MHLLTNFTRKTNDEIASASFGEKFRIALEYANSQLIESKIVILITTYRKCATRSQEKNFYLALVFDIKV